MSDDRSAAPVAPRRSAVARRPLPDETPDDVRLRAIVEALAFAAEEPLTLDDLKDLFPGAPEERLQGALDDVARSCDAPGRGIQIARVAGGYRMTTRPDLGVWVRALFRARNRRRLSAQALETLAIVAYRQPITTPEIQAIRGSDPAGVLEGLLEKRLVRVLGRKKVVGKPVVYGTTREFLEHFGLDSLEELPDVEEFGGLSPANPVAARAAAGGPYEEDDDEDGDGSGGDDDEDEHERGDDGDDS